MKRTAACVLALLTAAACQPSEPAWLHGYAEGEYVRLAAPEAGWVESIAVERGDLVTPGMPLYTLEAGRQRAALAAAEAGLAEARAQELHAAQDLERQEQLARTDVAARARLDGARAQAAETRAQVDAAEAAVAQARWDLDQRTVCATTAGLVEDRVRQPGEWVDAGGVVLSLLPPERVKVRFFVPEPMLGAVRVGQGVALRCDGCAPDLRGTIRYVAPDAEYTPPVIYSLEARGKLVFMVEAWPDAGTVLHPGQPVDVDLRQVVAQGDPP